MRAEGNAENGEFKIISKASRGFRLLGRMLKTRRHAGIQSGGSSEINDFWIPACAGMTATVWSITSFNTL
jgi:hypothetical protein